MAFYREQQPSGKDSSRPESAVKQRHCDPGLCVVVSDKQVTTAGGKEMAGEGHTEVLQQPRR